MSFQSVSRSAQATRPRILGAARAGAGLPTVLLFTVAAFLLLPALAAAQGETSSSGKSQSEKPRFQNHWVVLMELGDRAADFDSKRENELKRAHLRYMHELEKAGDLLLSSGFRVHEDERHRELAFYREDLEREKVEKMAAESPIVKAGLWKPFVYRWSTARGDLTFGTETP